jgi:NADPH:quinone reductase-like Zn-dependent oxidoreductase
MFEAMNEAIEVNRIRPVIDRVFRFDEARQAFEYFFAKKYFGKVCVVIGNQ